MIMIIFMHNDIIVVKFFFYFFQGMNWLINLYEQVLLDFVFLTGFVGGL